jgi:hypothetical protein
MRRDRSLRLRTIAEQSHRLASRNLIERHREIWIAEDPAALLIPRRQAPRPKPDGAGRIATQGNDVQADP